MYWFRKYTLPSVWIAVFIILAYYPLITDQLFFACDMLDCWLPWRFFESSQIKLFSWPLWNPYQACGMPVYGDLQGPMFNPFFLLQSFIFSHPLDSLIPSYLACIFCGAMGIYMLAGQFKVNSNIRLLLAISYAGSAFFYAHSQHFYAIISAAWIPWQYFFYLRFLHQPHALNSSAFIFTTFLLTTAGNPGFTIISVWLLFATTIHRLTYIYLYGENPKLINILKKLTWLIIGVLPSNMIIIISAFHIIPFISRHNGLDLHHAAQNPATAQSFISFIFPFPAWIPGFAEGTDITMKNYYSGAGMFLIAIIIILIKLYKTIRNNKSSENKVSKINSISLLKIFIPDDYLLGLKFTWILIGLIFLLVSLGEISPLFSLFYHLMPGASWFRFPAYYTYFIFILWIIPACSWIPNIIIRKKIVFLTGIIYILILVLLFQIIKMEYLENKIAAFIILNILGFIGLYIFLYNKKHSWKQLGFLFFTVDLIISVRYGIQYTLAGKYTKNEIKIELLDAPDLSGSISNVCEARDQNQYFSTLWRNTNVFLSRVSADYFNSFEPDSFVELVSYHPQISKKILCSPLAQLDISKTPIPAKFNSNSFIFKFKSLKSDSLILLQNYHPFWKAINNNKESEVVPYYSFMKIPVLQGENSISLRFSPPYFNYALFLSYGTLILSFIISIISFYQLKFNLFTSPTCP